MIAIIDNYDSFTYNLVQRLGEINPAIELSVFRNDQIGLEELENLQPSQLIISPGPCTPKEAGISVACVERFHGRIPILGVCLGHQSIGQATGGVIVRAEKLMHGKTDQIEHAGTTIFSGLPNPLRATRYHSLVIRPDSLSPEFRVNAWTRDTQGNRIIMGIEHRTFPTFGVQFHPESFLTERGIELLRNFLFWQPDRATVHP
jgi:anthranilate synthase/aminodeoxychorismate synthase-like glutamine amidotransferase